MSQHQDDPIEFILLEVAGHDFCIDIGSVREIRGYSSATPLPQAPDYLLGVINLRGAVMPVVDLRARLGFGRTEANGRHVILVVQHEEQTAGLLVDAVQETIILPASQLQPPPAYASSAAEVFVDALMPLEGRILGRLSASALLGEDLAVAA